MNIVTRKKKQNTPQCLAAIDIGTNSFHLIVVEILPDGKFRILDRAKENVRLGQGSRDMKMITSDATDRAIDTLKRFAGIAGMYQAPIRAVATSAAREAINQVQFMKKVHEATGISVEIVSGFEEARLIYLGILQALPVFEKKVLMIDIGGGSVEFLIGRRGASFYANSLKLGCIRLTQNFFPMKNFREKDVKACREFVSGFLSPVCRELRRHQYEVAVGSSGTILNIANMIRAKRGEVLFSPLNNFSFTNDELSDAVKVILKSKTEKERLKIRGLDPKRVDIIIAGAIVLEECFKALKIPKMNVSEFALREGIVYDFLQHRLQLTDHAHHLSNIRYQSVMKLSENFQNEAAHAEQTKKLALKLFDQTRKLHKFTDREREFLEYAAILHEIGFFISHDQHHIHSYYLIRNSELLGFTDTEKEIIATVARYHRKSHPKMKHDGFKSLNNNDQLMVRKLAGMLRIADGLDRGHKAQVNALRCKIQPRKVLIKVQSSKNVDLELWAANMKKQLFEEVFRKQVVLTS